jgi:hypothetical protein
MDSSLWERIHVKAISELLKAHFFKGGFVSTTVKRQWRLEKRERMKKGGFDVGGGFCRTRRSCRFRPRSTTPCGLHATVITPQ